MRPGGAWTEGSYTAVVATAAARTQARRDEVKARLRGSMLDLVRERPFRELKIEEVTRSAGLSRSAFYFYYRDKQDLLMDAASEASEAVFRQADRWWHGEGEPAELVREALSGVAEVWGENAELLSTAVEVSTYDPEVRVFWRGLVHRFVEATAAHITREQGAGRIDPDLDPVSTSEILIWGAERTLYVFVLTGERSAEEIVAGLADVWMRALYGGR